MVDSSQGGEGDGENSSGGHSDEGLPPSIARAWRTFDVAKQIEYETKEEHKAEKARLQKIMQVLSYVIRLQLFYFCERREE